MFKTFTTTAIDAVQTSKKMAVDTFVKNEELAKALNTFVDTQADYTKKTVDAFTTVGGTISALFMNKDFYKDSLTAYQESFKSFLPKGK